MSLTLSGKHALGKTLRTSGSSHGFFSRLLDDSETLTATIVDSDGQFLLIEAAEVLPRAFDPETSIHNLFLRNGTFVVLGNPVGKQSGLSTNTSIVTKRPSGKLDLNTALAAAQTNQLSLPGPAVRRINEVLFARLRDYPEKATEFHNARVIMPLKVAQVLRSQPKLLPVIIEALIERDFEESIWGAKMSFFGTNPLVAQRVRFTRCIYAMLQVHRYHPPPIYAGLAPVPTGLKDARPAAFQLGVKVAAGLEILFNQQVEKGAQRAEAFLRNFTWSGDFEHCAHSKELSLSANDTLVSLDYDPGWKRFLEKLVQDRILSRDEEERTKDEELMARIAYARHCEEQRRLEPNVTELKRRFPVYADIKEGLSSNADPNSFTPFEELSSDDSEAWMHVTPSELRAMKEAKNKADDVKREQMLGTSLARATDGGKNTNETAVERIQRFILEEKSGYEGIENPGERAYFDGGTSDGDRYGDDEIFSMRDMMDALDKQVTTQGLNHSLLSKHNEDDSVDDSFRRPKRPITLPNDNEESSLWSDVATPSSEAGMDIPRAAVDDYVKAMDAELERHEGLRNDFEKVRGQPETGHGPRKYDLKYNLAKNWAEAYAAEGGTPGPVSGMLNSLGLRSQVTGGGPPDPNAFFKSANEKGADGEDAEADDDNF
eukprot:CAMPEP_0184504792 /NCGR_PEP_ID=MMETSP0113_2-20130426/52648_1 /TAXON_ID=91329 /ORGANISM="Norrisiella sphaerica, Strain BC52" /LENGTH=658 /DNA_ID=CAMNT_0026894451 /DNA_START=741 /DNA_END=2716 /DNA_ORIENTATION=+